MKTLLTSVLLLVLALWGPSVVGGAWWDPILTGKSSCAVPGYFVNPVDCSKFFRCADHSTPERNVLVRYDFDCPTGTVFDQNVKVCVYPSATGCPGGAGWSPPSGGWSPPSVGWSPPSGGWSPPKGGWGPPSGGWGHHDHHDHGHSYWSFTPGSSFVVIYDHHGKKRAATYHPED